MTWHSVASTACLLVLALVVHAEAQSPVSRASRHPAGYDPSGLTIDYEGFTTPKYDIMVAATDIGRLDQVHVKVGDQIRAGQIVAQLEDGLQKEAVATAKWRAQMHGETDAAKAESLLKKQRLEQLQSLAELDSARPDELKRAFADWEIAKARELAAVEQDRLRQLELSRYELQLKRRSVVAPMDGFVAEIYHWPGEYITPADPAVIRLVVVDELYGVFNIPVEEIAPVKLGTHVSVYLTSSSKSVQGTIASISPDIDGESGTIQVKVLIDNRGGALRSGDRCQMRAPQPRSASRRLPSPAVTGYALTGQRSSGSTPQIGVNPVDIAPWRTGRSGTVLSGKTR